MGGHETTPKQNSHEHYLEHVGNLYQFIYRTFVKWLKLQLVTIEVKSNSLTPNVGRLSTHYYTDDDLYHMHHFQTWSSFHTIILLLILINHNVMVDITQIGIRF